MVEPKKRLENRMNDWEIVKHLGEGMQMNVNTAQVTLNIGHVLLNF